MSTPATADIPAGRLDALEHRRPTRAEALRGLGFPPGVDPGMRIAGVPDRDATRTGGADPHAWVCWRDASHEGVRTEPLLGWPRCAECGAAPGYHERGRYLPTGFHLDVYVPRSETRSGALLAAAVSPGSAIVGHPDQQTIWFEGWVHGQYRDRDPLDRWRFGVLHAVDRMVTAYPTTAMRALIGPREETLQLVGTYDPIGRWIDVEDPAALRTWLAAD